jgi:long-chain acyl-CoA synthetase
MTAVAGPANFLERIFRRLADAPKTRLLREVRGGKGPSASGSELLSLIAQARAFLKSAGLKRGDRCALHAGNSVRWVAADLAIMAEGLIAVPLYSRQAASELAVMLRDCSPVLIISGDATLGDAIAREWPEHPRIAVLDEVFEATKSASTVSEAPVALTAKDPVTIIYTSGTSGEAKGVILTVGNLDHMLRCTNERLNDLMVGYSGQDHVFHYLPFCFAGSWILLLTSLLRGSLLTMATDLSKLAEDMRSASPHYFLNVPVLLERMRTGVDEQIRKTGGVVHVVYEHAKEVWFRRRMGDESASKFWIWLANLLVFPTVRKKMIGGDLRGLICGSAPLAVETQLYFTMLAIPVLQVYGLTETTAICTMDCPGRVEPGFVGPAIPEVEMKLGEQDEILVRGPNIFAGYWNRSAATAQAMRDGWFHTGDQGELNQAGNWRIIGRLKNLIVLSSGHNVAPEPIEDMILHLLPDAQQVVLVGHGKPFVGAVVTGDVTRDEVNEALEIANPQWPHYKRVRSFLIHPEPFSVESGLLTANGKLRREAISARLQTQIEEMYSATPAA